MADGDEGFPPSGASWTVQKPIAVEAQVPQLRATCIASVTCGNDPPILGSGTRGRLLPWVLVVIHPWTVRGGK